MQRIYFQSDYNLYSRSYEDKRYFGLGCNYVFGNKKIKGSSQNIQ